MYRNVCTKMKLGSILFLLLFCKGGCQIINGVKAGPGQFPYVVQVHPEEPQIEVNLQNKHLRSPTIAGTGVIIGRKFVLTAAHLVRKEIKVSGRKTGVYRNYGEVYVVAGNLHLDYEPFGYIKKKVETILAHPSYDGQPDTYDIALLHLEQPFPFNDQSLGVSSIEMATKGPAVGDNCMIMGWGKTSWQWTETENGKIEAEYLDPTNYLMWGRTKISNTCSSRYRGEEFICGWHFGYSPGYSLTAKGDSGSPLVCLDEATGRNKLYGTHIGGDGDRPAVYAKLSFYRNWIDMWVEYFQGVEEDQINNEIFDIMNDLNN